MNLKPETVANTIRVWNKMYPGKRTKEDEALFSGKFFKALRNLYSDEAWKVAVDIVEGEQEFFPTIAHMRKAHSAAIAQLQRASNEDQLLLAEETGNLTPEELEINEDRMRVVRMAIAGEITYAEAEQQLNQMIGYAKTQGA